MGDSAEVLGQSGSAGPGAGSGSAAGVAREWYPGLATYTWWFLLGGLLAGVGGLAYLWIASGGRIPNEGSFNLVLTLGLVVALGAAHEGIHGLAMLAVGARPRFGILRYGRTVMGFYTSSPGRRFTRGQYLLVGLAPMVIIAPAGVLVCLTPVGSAVWFAFAVHLGGCIGDLTIARLVLREPAGTTFEDRPDSLTVWAADSAR